MDYQWRFDVAVRYLPFLLEGVKMTVLITLISMGIGIVIGLVVALIRLSKLRGVYHVATLYVDFFRSTPVLVQLIWIYYCLPIITGRSFSAFASGAIALSLYAGSFLAEIFRAGILSISKGQTEAALALGMTPSQTLRRIIVPQAVFVDRGGRADVASSSVDRFSLSTDGDLYLNGASILHLDLSSVPLGKLPAQEVLGGGVRSAVFEEWVVSRLSWL
jgi:His/Glu/Gln/Arg/opine family amino acid ABC transporter permease subunit